MSKSYMNLDVTYEYAVNKLAQKDPGEMAVNAGVEYDKNIETFTVTFLGDKYHVKYPGGEVNLADKEGDVPLTSKILILHYLTTANGSPLQMKYISFKELPDGAIYIQPFTNRAVRPLLNYFAEKQEELKKIALSLGGKIEGIGDTSVTIYAFPRVPITYVIWSGDDEFPASGNVLFDASAPGYLPTEDYALLSGLVVHHMGKMIE